MSAVTCLTKDHTEICTRFLQLIDTASHSLLKIPLSHVAFCVQQWNLNDRCFCAPPCIGPWFAFCIEFRRRLLYSLMGNHRKLFWAVLQGHCKWVGSEFKLGQLSVSASESSQTLTELFQPSPALGNGTFHGGVSLSYFCSHCQLQSFHHAPPLSLRSQGPHPLSCLQLGHALLSGPSTRWWPLPCLCVTIICNLPDCSLRVRAQAGIVVTSSWPPRFPSSRL